MWHLKAGSNKREETQGPGKPEPAAHRRVALVLHSSAFLPSRTKKKITTEYKDSKRNNTILMLSALWHGLAKAERRCQKQ